MRELLKEVSRGWKEMTGSGKYMVLLLAALFYLWYGKRKEEKCLPAQKLLIYTTFVLIAAVVPLSGILLRFYQTRFYDYVWVLAYLPVTLMIAYGLVVFFMDCYEKEFAKDKRKTAFLALLVGAVFVLCGNLHVGDYDIKTQDLYAAMGVDPGKPLSDEDARKEVAALLGRIKEKARGVPVCLWAPDEILTYVRLQDGETTLLYGRNMWEEALNAYAYDEYSPEVKDVWRWMKDYAAYFQKTSLDAGFMQNTSACVETALANGVNCLILPEFEGEEAGRVIQTVEESVKNAGFSVIKERSFGYSIFWAQ